MRGGLIATACAGLVFASAARAGESRIGAAIDRLSAQLAAEDEALVGGRIFARWSPDGRAVIFTSRADPAVRYGARREGRVETLIEAKDVRAAIEAAGLSADACRLTSDPLTSGGERVNLECDGRHYGLTIGAAVLSPQPQLDRLASLHAPRVLSDQFPTTFGDLVEAVSPDGRRFVTLLGDDLYLRSAADGAMTRLTRDGEPHLTWRNTQESAQSFNVKWSPDGARIAAIQLDLRRVPFEPLQHWLGARPQIQPVAYPRAGEPMHAFRLAVIDVRSAARMDIATGDTTDNYLDLVGWSADGSKLYYRTIDREHHHLRLYAANPFTGAAHLILSEDRATYIDTPMTLGPEIAYPLKHSNGLLILSEEDGWRHIYLHDAMGGLERRLTTGPWPVADIVCIDEAAGYVYFRAAMDPEHPYDLAVYRTALSGGSPERLTPEPGLHRIDMAPDGLDFIDEVSSPTESPVTRLRRADGRLVSVLSTADATRLAALGFGGFEPFTAKASDPRFETRGIIARPYGFDPARRYPVVEFIYGGMQASQAPADFYTLGHASGAMVLRSLLGAGFVVVMIDAPGTPGRGRAFQDATYGVWPQGVIANHVAWIQAAAADRPWMDLTRVGVYGHSWGGYMAVRAMIDAPGVYAVAVSHAAPQDFVDHPTYIEPFMGLPANNPAGYAAASNLNQVSQIKGPVLVMGMPLDVNAGFTPTMKFVNAMVEAKKDIDLFILPEANHSLSCCGRDKEIYMTALITQYLEDHLKSR
jgi:dipeptidyl aminopeptidase/acylaminoacyl peptidase